MSGTATAAYYRRLRQTNQALAADGATRISLAQLSWGPIGVDGSTATATTSERRNTTFGDGTSDDSTDTNVYTSVQQDGRWLIAADRPGALAPGVAWAGAAGRAAAPAQPTPWCRAGRGCTS